MFHSAVPLLPCHSNQDPREAAQALLLSVTQTSDPQRSLSGKPGESNTISQVHTLPHKSAVMWGEIFQLQRTSNFIPVVLEAVPSAKLIFLNIAARFAATSSVTANQGRSQELRAASLLLPCLRLLRSKGTSPLVCLRDANLYPTVTTSGAFSSQQTPGGVLQDLPNNYKLPKLFQLSHLHLCGM